MSASAPVNVSRNSLSRIGWIVLLVSATLMTLNHFGLIFFLDDPVLFLGWTTFNLYALLIIVIPFRRREKWAWYATWILPIGLAAGGVTAPDIAVFYYAVAAACVLGLLLTVQNVFAVDRAVPHQAR